MFKNLILIVILSHFHTKSFVSKDIEIEMIGKGVDELHELAKMANEEVRLQSRMLDVLEAKIDDVHDHVTNVNVKLKTTLEEARKSDKICMVRSSLNVIEFSLIFSYATSHPVLLNYIVLISSGYRVPLDPCRNGGRCIQNVN